MKKYFSKSQKSKGSASPIFLVLISLALFVLSAYSLSLSFKNQGEGNLASIFESIFKNK